MTVATAPREIGPLRSLPSFISTGSFRVRSVSAHDAGEVWRRFCTVTPSTVPLPASALRAVWKTVMTRKSLVISWKGYEAAMGVRAPVPKICPTGETSTTMSLLSSMLNSLPASWWISFSSPARSPVMSPDSFSRNGTSRRIPVASRSASTSMSGISSVS